jgi:hypothetical protein
MRSYIWPIAVAAALGCVDHATAQGPRWTGDYINQLYQPGPKDYYQSAPFTHKYNYNTGGIINFNGSTGQVYYFDYLDRFDRALKFGYPIPRDPTLAHRPPRIGPDGAIVIDPADPNTDPADIFPSPPPGARRGLFRRN